MNAVEIEEAVSKLAAAPFDAKAFPFTFLEAFGNKATTIARLKSGASNASDIPAGVLQRNNIHIAVAEAGGVSAKLAALKASPKTTQAKAKFILATDGEIIEAEDMASEETLACAYADLANGFGFFLPLAGITTVKQIRNNPIDIKATGRLNRLYVELLKENAEWSKAERRHDMNQFMARLIFCFFAEDTGIFYGEQTFTRTIEQMSDSRAGNTHEVLAELFRAMDTPIAERKVANIRPYADVFPYVNGGLFAHAKDVPRFSRIARSYLLHAGSLDWKQINPDIFGSMIQAVADDEERGALGLHYTSVPNILKVLNPLFLDDLREMLEEARDNSRKLLNLRRRMAAIRVFDPACGSGNFLVIAYKHMREIEAEINRRRGEAERPSDIPLTNFRGIELRDFAAEIARLALIIAEYQCDVLYRGDKLALAEFLPLDAANWITCGNALRLDWLSICPPTGTGVKLAADDLFHTPLEQARIDFENAGGATYICGNPPYSGYNKQSKIQKEDLEHVFEGLLKNWGNLDYVSAWFAKAAIFLKATHGAMALVATNSVCQGGQVPVLWPLLANSGLRIRFAHTSFKWANLAAHNAGITVVVVGLTAQHFASAKLFEDTEGGQSVREVSQLNGYLISGPPIYVSKRLQPISNVSTMSFGNHPYYGAPLIMSADKARELATGDPIALRFLRPIYGSTEVIGGAPRWCLWIEDRYRHDAEQVIGIGLRLNAVRELRLKKVGDGTAQLLASAPHRFRDVQSANHHFIAVPQTTSENRKYLPCDLMDKRAIVTFKCYALYDAPLWNLAIVASSLHIAWIGTVCGRLEMRFSYSNTLGWNTFPVPPLTEKNKADLTRCAEDILLAREAHFPKTIADLYDPDDMPEDLRRAHERNDETLERIYIGRRFKNDTERLEKLFEMYTTMTAEKGTSKAKKAS